MFLVQIDEIANTIAVLFRITVLTEAIIWPGLSKTCGTAANSKYFQILQANLLGLGKKIFFIYDFLIKFMINIYDKNVYDKKDFLISC